MKREPRSGRGIHAHRHDRVLFGGMLDDLAAESVRPEAGDSAGIGAVEGKPSNGAAHEVLLA
jgi:hypothetical protein